MCGVQEVAGIIMALGWYNRARLGGVGWVECVIMVVRGCVVCRWEVDGWDGGGEEAGRLRQAGWWWMCGG